jgi:3,4-dihydroxy 2-butanone 4-phosphate synthase/GTP cyclohydrolase II
MTPEPKQFIQQIVDRLKNAEIIILEDDAVQGSNYFMVAAASLISEDNVARMVSLAKGILCAAMTDARLRELGLAPMLGKSGKNAMDFSVSVEARQGVTTGISAADRAVTLKALALSHHPKRDLVTPGHMFPIRTKDGGVLVRNAPAEGAVDLMRLAELEPVAALIQCLDSEGAILNKKTLKTNPEFAQFPLIRLSQIAESRSQSAPIVEQIASAQMPSNHFGNFTAYCFKTKTDNAEHLALVKGNIPEQIAKGESIPVRVQAENAIVDLLGAPAAELKKDDSSDSPLPFTNDVRRALHTIEQAGCGIFVYIRHPRQGALQAQVRAMGKKNEKNIDSSASAEIREYGIGAQILQILGATSVCLLTNSKKSLAGINAFGIKIVEQKNFY